MTATTFDMEPMDLDIHRKRGDTFPFILNLKDSAGAVFGDIAGATFFLSVDVLENPTDDSQQLFQTVPTIVAPSTNAKITVPLTLAQADQAPSTYYYDCQMKDSSGFLRTVAKGEWVVSQDITKDT